MTNITDLPGKTITLQRHELLKTAGETDTNVYFIESGSLKIYVLDNDEEQIIRFGYKGNIIVSLDSFFSGKPSPMYIQAIKKSVVKIILKEQIDAFLKPQENKTQWIAILENLVLQQMDREIDILTSSPIERYRRVLKRSPQLFQEIPDKHIANYLRMSPETLSRLKSVDADQDLSR